MDKWDLVQWGYITIILLGLYFIGLCFIWLRSKKYMADPFFYYMFLLTFSIVISRFATAVARHYLLIGSIDVTNFMISSWWWSLRNVPSIVLLFAMNIHATIRYCRQKNNPDKHRRIGD